LLSAQLRSALSNRLVRGSLLTQTLIIHVIRTNRIPFLESRASWPLTLTSLTIIVIGLWLPLSPLAPSLGFTPLPNF
jgi:Mg2+-importing ATPase